MNDNNDNDNQSNDDHVSFPKMSDSTLNWKLPPHSKLFSESKKPQKKKIGDKIKILGVKELTRCSNNDWCVMVRKLFLQFEI